MTPYTYANWIYTTDADRLKWTEEDWVKAKAEHEIHKQKNIEEFRSRMAVRKEMMEMTSLAYGQNSLVEKYLKKNEPPRWTQYDIEASYRRWKEAKAKEIQEAKVVEANKAETKLNEEAVIWLQEHGKKLGVDFSLEDAIHVANDLAADIERDRMKKSGGFHSFSGEDNCEGCHGWDGESHRCECGNRRVSWTTDTGHSFKSPYIYAEAY
jgi:alpha-galactosidase/6-phospho-beta-glucosidase family protein